MQPDNQSASAVQSEDGREVAPPVSSYELSETSTNGTEASEAFDPLHLRDRVVIKLLFGEFVTEEQVAQAWERWRKMSEEKRPALWRVLMTVSGVDASTVREEAAKTYAFDTVSVPEEAIRQFIEKVKEQDLFSDEQWRELIDARVLPVGQEDGKDGRVMVFGTHEPTRHLVSELLKRLPVRRFEVQYLSEDTLDTLLQAASSQRNQYLDAVEEGEVAVDLGSSFDQQESLVDEDELESQMSRSALINLFEAMLVEAVHQEVSDIHIVPGKQREVEIHFRKNGELTPWHINKRIHPEAFLAVVKDNTLNVDRFERQKAQDGFIQRSVDNTVIRYRVSILPITTTDSSLHAESVVIRVLDDRRVISSLRELGLPDHTYKKVDRAIRQPYGMVVLTGPTGSGKTTTLYAALQEVVTPRLNVITVEDPVEYVLPGVRQVKLSHKLGMEQAMRSILRHDPDIVMVGEMRDRETAELAIKLANTGHLTFSTLHTNDAPSALSRLYKMGIEPFLIASSINLVVAQRLIRTLCSACKEPETIADEMLEAYGFEDVPADATFYRHTRSDDCPVCGGTGFNGRRAICEGLPFSDEIRKHIVTAGEVIDEQVITKTALDEGMVTLQGAARQAVLRGETSLQEMLRVVFTGMQ